MVDLIIKYIYIYLSFWPLVCALHLMSCHESFNRAVCQVKRPTNNVAKEPWILLHSVKPFLNTRMCLMLT